MNSLIHLERSVLHCISGLNLDLEENGSDCCQAAYFSQHSLKRDGGYFALNDLFIQQSKFCDFFHVCTFQPWCVPHHIHL